MDMGGHLKRIGVRIALEHREHATQAVFGQLPAVLHDGVDGKRQAVEQLMIVERHQPARRLRQLMRLAHERQRPFQQRDRTGKQRLREVAEKNLQKDVPDGAESHTS